MRNLFFVLTTLLFPGKTSCRNFSEYSTSLDDKVLKRAEQFDSLNQNEVMGSNVLDRFNMLTEEDTAVTYRMLYSEYILISAERQNGLGDSEVKVHKRGELEWFEYTNLRFEILKSPLICDVLIVIAHGEDPLFNWFSSWKTEYVVTQKYCYIQGIPSKMERYKFKVILSLLMVHYITEGLIVTQESLKHLSPSRHGVLGVMDFEYEGQFPIIFFNDADTLITNKNIRIEDIIHKVQNASLQPTIIEDFIDRSILPGWWQNELSETSTKSRNNSSLIDIIVAKDPSCHEYMWMMNSGVMILRPSETTARFLLSILFHLGAVPHDPFDHFDQGAMTFTLQHVFNFPLNLLWTVCLDRENQKWEASDTSQLLMIGQQSPYNISYLPGVNFIDRLYQFYYKKFGYPSSQRRFGSAALTHSDWFNARGCSASSNGVYGGLNSDYWAPGDFLVHFNGCDKCQLGGQPMRDLMHASRSNISVPFDLDVDWTKIKESGYCSVMPKENQTGHAHR